MDLNKEKIFLLCHGNIYNENAKGTNLLIKDGAEIFTKTEDLL
jgi:predicted Rossmann fold nucleotide-binding protein DprA/Smf involved in DNA uptake